MNETDWLPGVAVLAVSAVAGVLLAVRARRGAALPQAADTRRAELLRQKEALYALVREHDALRTDEPEWRAERTRLELEAARVLRALDDVRDEPVGPGFGARHPRLVGALWGGTVVAFAAGLAFTLQEFTKPRAEGESITGNAQSSPEALEASLAPLRAAVAAAPADMAAKNRLGHALLNAGDTMGAYKLSEEVVAADPDDPEARTHQGVVLVAIGDVEVAGKVFDRVLAGHPDFTEALGWRGAVYMQVGDTARAAELWERAVASDPSLGSTLLPLIARAKGPLVGSFGTQVSSRPGGGDLAAPPSDQDVTGEIAGDAALLASGGTLFLYARPEGVDRGPPVWAQKLTPTAFPVRFRIGPADSPMGGATPDKLVLSARMDPDGDPKTRDGAEGRSAVIAPGATGVVITLSAGN